MLIPRETYKTCNCVSCNSWSTYMADDILAVFDF